MDTPAYRDSLRIFCTFLQSYYATASCIVLTCRREDVTGGDFLSFMRGVVQHARCPILVTINKIDREECGAASVVAARLAHNNFALDGAAVDTAVSLRAMAGFVEAVKVEAGASITRTVVQDLVVAVGTIKRALEE